MIKVFIDESGNMGRGGKYFVLAAVVFGTDKGAMRAKRIIRKEQQSIALAKGRTKTSEIKSRTLSFARRQHILNRLVAGADINFFYLAVDKPQVTLLQQGKSKNLVYNYFAKLLTDQIFARYDDDFYVVFDQRSTAVKSMNSLNDYITINAYTQFNHAARTITVKQMDSKTANNLQTADIIAGTVYRAYREQKSHFLNLIRPHIIKADEFPRGRFEGSMLGASCFLGDNLILCKQASDVW